ncbi:MAG: hypothetical protein AB1690_02410 [Candidatus Zixiibacteriota bacterium]
MKQLQGMLISLLAILALGAICAAAPTGVWLHWTAVPDDANESASGPASYYVLKVFEDSLSAADSVSFWSCNPLSCVIVPATPTPSNPGQIDSAYAAFSLMPGKPYVFYAIVACDTTGTFGAELRGPVSNVKRVNLPDMTRPARIVNLEVLRYE